MLMLFSLSLFRHAFFFFAIPSPPDYADAIDADADYAQFHAAFRFDADAADIHFHIDVSLFRASASSLIFMLTPDYSAFIFFRYAMSFDAAGFAGRLLAFIAMSPAHYAAIEFSAAFYFDTLFSPRHYADALPAYFICLFVLPFHTLFDADNADA